ncbi:alpha/beta hydrolase fold domain-containing protein [Spongiibacter sp. KMU-158]|uniref:Alpha/beta hydrolase fold domain-containing protein n=1 Tax=Spongiibacter pelagi TaxID=2760804 RepID=A0A927C3Q0_9GAMM|nr:alpha/beta hydrolase [Spongiibacter pelagi]MBD2860244.1 alpha/beta hydrolase fold domain-containing protein [Spongiibacter pelagi]
MSQTTTNSTLNIQEKNLRLSFKSRLTVLLMRLIGKRYLGHMMQASLKRMGNFQVMTAGMKWPEVKGVSISYEIIGRSPGHVIGELDTEKPFLLWLHGGAFILPAAPNAHLYTAGKLCRALGANGFLPDYRLAPTNPFPACLGNI